MKMWLLIVGLFAGPAWAGAQDLGARSDAAIALLEQCAASPNECRAAKHMVGEALFVRVIDTWVQHGRIEHALVADLELASPTRFAALPQELQRPSEPHDWMKTLTGRVEPRIMPIPATTPDQGAALFSPLPQPALTGTAVSVPAAIISPSAPASAVINGRPETPAAINTPNLPRPMLFHIVDATCEVEVWIAPDGTTENVLPTDNCASAQLFAATKRALAPLQWPQTKDEEGTPVRAWRTFTHRYATLKNFHRDEPQWQIIAEQYDLLEPSRDCQLVLEVVPDGQRMKVVRMASNDPHRCGFRPLPSTIRFPPIAQTTTCKVKHYQRSNEDLGMNLIGCSGVRRATSGLFRAGLWSPFVSNRAQVDATVVFIPN